ncbi:uncharacterized protein LOC110974087 isoform X2 [Acanthaster planci]|uniref:Uncharacterized protein LOC110974087 isoform X2 n=1 Tax=Acanthaster planci TaxID=133434 RepID=A0A8B7XMD4_ACAPL|nr:uncharacterized protein LOC110974087 isoform X2 [Acanthaster planci]
MNTEGICVLLACVALAVGEVCKFDGLQAVSKSYKISEDHVLFGILGACPPVGEERDPALRFRITDNSQTPGLWLLDSTTGEFRFEPALHFVGVVSFTYIVTDSSGQTSLPAKVTILVRGNPAVPLLELHKISAASGTYVPLGMQVTIEQEGPILTVAMCNCNETLQCHRDTASCYCILTLPNGWELADGLTRRLSVQELNNLSPDQLQNLTLKTQVTSAGRHCFEVHAVNWNVATEEPLDVKRKLLIDIGPLPTTSHNTHNLDGPTTSVLQLDTREGQVIRFGGLRVRDTDDVKGTYRVRVSLDQGGTLWVKQDERPDVIFFPKESDSPEWVLPNSHKEYRNLHRFGNFYETYEPFDNRAGNNGKKQLSFVGSLEGINHVLAGMVYVPWCPHWPTPPSWNLPESSWMDPSNHDQLMSDDPLKPVIWPQWYPRFWYPFPRKSWTWWPRVLPPWWLNQSCSDWTSHVHLEMHEITPATCDVDTSVDMVRWDADIHVRTRESEPKSLITDNLFTYFSEDARSFLLQNLYIRSKEETFQVMFTLQVVEKQLATIENTDTNRSTFTCTSVPDCNDKLQKIRVHLLEGSEGACKVTIEIRMYKDGSDRLSDYMMLWAYKTKPECINYLYNDKDAVIEPSQNQITVWQGEIVPMDLRYATSVPDRTGILHTVIYADHGLVTVSAPDGLRVYMDHMGQHNRIPSYLCISGPTDMVLQALLSAKFTPFKNFKGEATVKVNYTVPFMALRETYGVAVRPPMRRAVVTFEVVNGERPYLPLLAMPSKVCMTEMDLLPLDMMRIEGRYAEDEPVSMSMVALKGQLIVEQSRISELYECPTATAGSDGACIEECSFHTACPGTKMCCHQGCSRICTESQKVATVESHTPQNVNIHGNISTINRVLEAENLWYLAKPCQTDDNGEIVTDRVIETQEDAIRIEIIPARNPEGDSVFGTIFVQINCTPPMKTAPAPVNGAGSAECQEEWGAWRDCQVSEGTCGRGTQVRFGLCGTEELRQERPCIVCGCKPEKSVLVDPSTPLRGCASDHPIQRCPTGCAVDSYHMEMHSFTCSPPEDPDTDAQALPLQRTKSIEVHDSCTCSACLTYE